MERAELLGRLEGLLYRLAPGIVAGAVSAAIDALVAGKVDQEALDALATMERVAEVVGARNDRL